ncbi:hypothetical protein [Frigoriglobus tundricola]|uniref:Uncharacterized protein n=1 Tax=Frigoriglobus tundricola TaxID=2774151 RepID=A0A6M5YY20_9BACT|nr:hypothetical protein [Frigoriglobus tundricola]QJW98768.1 hypothetical protein FTUN_6363 [Frigoriglobus tundricola]
MSTEADAEAAWFTCTDPRPMCALLRGKERGRKFRLFASACCRRIAHLLTDDRSHHALDLFERFLDGELTMTEYAYGERAAAEACAAQARIAGGNETARGTSEADRVRLFACMFAAQAVTDCYGPVASAAVDCCGALRGHATADIRDEARMRETGERIEAAERAAQAELLRDIFGNPIYPIALDPTWRTTLVVTLAQKMYAARDFGAMPDLADALQDAGCENERVLSHCRYSDRAHTRGCWLIDLVLGKA